MRTFKSKPLVYAAWTLIAMLLATVVKYATDISWPMSLMLATLTGLFGCLSSIFLCRCADKQHIARLSLIVFGGVGLMLTIVIPGAKGTTFDPTAMKMLLFTAAGLVLTAFFLPDAQPTGSEPTPNHESTISN